MKATYRECTDLEMVRARALAQCTLPPCSMTKRFARELKDQVTNQGVITERQASYLAVCCYRFRRQLPSELVPDSPPPGYQTPSFKSRQAEEKARYNAAMLEKYQAAMAGKS